MKIIALLVAALLLAPVLHAQTVKAAEPPKASCPCDNPNFKPLTEKARAVEAYWEARRDYNLASTIAGTAALFALFSRNGGLMNEAQNTLSDAETKLFTARAKAEGLKGITVTDGDDKTVQIKLEKGVDYTL